MKAMIINQPGGVDKFELKNLELQKLGDNDVLVSQNSIGINHIDIYYRNGTYKLPSYPAILGSQACGIVEDVGDKVEGFMIGDLVAYATTKTGAYCDKRIIDANYLVSVPQILNLCDVASVLFQGLTAHYLLRRCFFLKPDHVILVNGASGSAGRILCQWAKFIGAKVIGAVGSDQKISIAKNAGCDIVINYRTSNLKDEILNLHPKGINIVYDFIGRDTFSNSLKVLQKFGQMVSVGNASGEIKPINISTLAKKSLFLTRPSIFDYKSARMELILSSAEVLEMLKNKHITTGDYKTYQLDQVAQAHQDIETRKIMGSAVIKL